jgi:two-component system, NarL family, response regulator
MSGGSPPIRILAVDDHPLVRQGIAGLVDVQPDMTVVAEAANGRDAINQFRTHRPDVTLMDIQMPEMNGLDALITIRTEFPDAKVIVLTTYEGDVHILRALKAGVLRATCSRTRSIRNCCRRSERSMRAGGACRSRFRSRSPST